MKQRNVIWETGAGKKYVKHEGTAVGAVQIGKTTYVIVHGDDGLMHKVPLDKFTP